MSDWRPSASRQALEQRAQLVRSIRAFFDQRQVLEVSTPLLTASGVTDVQIASVATRGPDGWLRTSPEYYHKRLLAAGVGDLFELGPVFRRGEVGRLHQPEFTLLEWYRLGWSWQKLAAEVVELLQQSLPDSAGQPARFISWQSCIREALGIDGLEIDDASLAELADDAPPGLGRDGLLDWLFASRVQPGFSAGSITVIHGYPASQAALARLDPDDPRVSERFEVFCGPIELANGYHELTCADQQRQRFERDRAQRQALGLEPMPIDEPLLLALESGLPDCSGVALGFDRLLMLRCRAEAIDEVVSFSHRQWR